MTDPPPTGSEDEYDDAPQAGPITEAVAANIGKKHIDRFLGMMERLIEAWSQRGHTVNTTRLHWNYVTLLVVSGLLSWLTWVGTLPGEALTGFLGTAVGYWLASANRPTR